ncbi:MAG: hypothetical protein GKC53_05435 [Neisseriaceae bacterium]|nr:MAG: hypothetical protein GKC53_05435 [Neisseriaceae bacterium]
MNNNIKVNPIYKAMGKTGQLFGVPFAPLFLTSAVFLLLVVFTGEWLYTIGLIPIFLILKVISKNDDKVFNNIYLKYFFLFKTIGSNPMSDKSPIHNFNDLRSAKKKFKSLTFSPNVSRRKKAKESKTNLDDTGLIDISNHLPYSTHVTDSIIMNKDGSLMVIWETDGIDFLTTSDRDLDDENDLIQNMIKTVGANADNVTFYYHKVKETIKIPFNKMSENWLANIIYKKYGSFIKEKRFKNSKIYFSMVWQPLSNIEKRNFLSNKKVVSNRNIYIKKFEELIKLVSSTFDSQYGKYLGTKLLKMREQGDVLTSDAVNFIHFLLTGERRIIQLGSVPIYNLLGDKRYHFCNDILEIKGINYHSYAREVEIKDYGNISYAGMYDILNLIEVDFVATHSFSLLNDKKGLSIIEEQAKRLVSGRDKAITQQEALNALQDDLSGGDIAVGKSHTTFFIRANTLEQLQENANKVVTALQKLGVVATFSDITLPSAFFAQLPANVNYRPRLTVLTSKNFANFSDFHGFYRGKSTGNAWGEAVVLLQNAFGEAFFFNFHEENPGNDFGQMTVAHTGIYGSIGSGKTLLMCFLLVLLQRFALPNTFPQKEVNKKAIFVFLDKDYGGEACIKGLGGKYFKIKNGEPTGFNPFQLENNEGNREFLFVLFKYIIQLNDNTFTSEHTRELTQAIASVMDLSKEERIFGVTRLAEFLSTSSNATEIAWDLSNRLSLWTEGQKYGWIFDNRCDELVFDERFINYGFDGTEFLDNKEVTNVISYYLLHRFQLLMDGKRFVLFIDEFWKWIRGDIFAGFVFDKFKTIRKLNAFIVTGTQSPSDVLKNEISSAIVEQTETKIFLSNKDALEAEYCGTKSSDDDKEKTRNFGCSEKEFQLIKSFNRSSRRALIKKGNSSTIVNVDFSMLGDYLKLLSTSKNSSEVLEQMEVGIYKDPRLWVDDFIRRS